MLLDNNKPTMHLWPAQKPVVNTVLDAYAHDSDLLQKRIYLAGEPGSGKTYMGSEVINHVRHDRATLLVVPNDIVTKWKTVLKGFAPDVKIKVFNTKVCRDNGDILLKPNEVNLIPNRYFNRLFCYDTDKQNLIEQMYQLKYIQGEPLTKTEKKHWTAVKNYKRTLKAKPLMVYDEVHKLKQSKLACFTALMKKSALPGLFLSGTIFNLNLGDVGRLITVTHPKLCQIYNDQEPNDFQYYENDYVTFIRRYWLKIAISISLHQVTNSINRNKLHQTILPIKPVKIDDEEYSYYIAVFKQLLSLNKKKNKAKLIASNFLDFPDREQSISVKSSARKDMLRTKTHAVVATPLINLSLKNTKKYQTMLKYLSKYANGSTIIYATDRDLILALAKQLNQDGYRTKYLPTSLNPDQYARYINNSLADGTDIFIVNPNDIAVGVDLHANLLIWYQLLLNMTQILQAQHRVFRASSEHSSNVVFLEYKLTYQQELVHEISNADKYNAGSYGVQANNNLAKVTGVLLNGINSNQH